jgi:hypothetical protein
VAIVSFLDESTKKAAEGIGGGGSWCGAEN